MIYLLNVAAIALYAIFEFALTEQQKKKVLDNPKSWRYFALGFLLLANLVEHLK